MLTYDQLAKLKEQVGRHLRYYNRLQRRMEQRGFCAEEHALVSEAIHKVHALSVHLHYASCRGGVGR